MVNASNYNSGNRQFEEVLEDKNLLLTDRNKILNVVQDCVITATDINYPLGSQFTIIVDPNVNCVFVNKRDGNTTQLEEGTNYIYVRRNGTLKTLTNGTLTGNNKTDSGFDVWLIGGQSNSSGANSNTVAGNGFDQLIDIVDPRVFQYGQYATETQYLDRIIQAKDPLKHPDTASRNANSVGFGVTFGRETANKISSDRNILLVPRGSGGSGMLGGAQEWNPYTNGSLLTGAISAANKAMASNPNNKFKGVLWCLGEAEAGSNITYTNELAALQVIIAKMRAEITGASDSLFIIASMVPDWVGAVAARMNIHRAMAEVPNIVSKSWFVQGNYNEHDSSANQDTTIIHYNSKGQRSLGEKLANAITKAEKNFVGNVLPNKINNVAIQSTYSNNYKITWNDTGFSYSYEVWTSVNGAEYTLYDTVLNKTVEIFGVTLNSTTRVRIRGKNVNGVGEFSDPLILQVPLIVTPAPPATKPYFRCNRDHYVLDGGGVFANALLDISGNNRHFLKQNTIKPNPSQINGINAIAFGSTGQANVVGVPGSFPSLSSYTLYALTYVTSLATAGVLFGATGLSVGTNNMVIWRQTTGQGTYKTGHSNAFAQIVSSVGIVINQWFVTWLTYNSTNNQGQIYINGTLAASGSIGAPIDMTNIAYNTFNVSNNGNNHFMLEFGCHDRVLNQSEITAEVNRMVSTYGITLGTPA